MKITIEQSKLMQGINTVSKAMSPKSITPVLEGVHLLNKGGFLQLTCTNNELTIETLLEANIEGEDALVLPGRLFSEVVRRLPNEQVNITTQASSHSVTISCGGSRTKLQYLDAEEFPLMPEVSHDNPVSMDPAVFKKMIRETAFAAATEDTRPILTGALLSAKDKELSLVALDGFRMAVRHEWLFRAIEPVSAVIPAKSLSEIARTIDEQGQELTLYFSPQYLLADLGMTRMTTILLQGEFINFQQVLPTDHMTRIEVDVAVLMDSIDRAALLAREGRNNLIKMQIQGENLVITANSEIGDVHEEVPIKLEGAELEIAFNAKFFMDILRVIDINVMFMDFNTSVSPCLIRPAEGDADQFLYLLLPVRVYGG